jgi:hypothetical protein
LKYRDPRGGFNFLVQDIYDLDGLVKYCIKELKIYPHSRIDSDRLITSNDLFNLPIKPRKQR